MPEEELPVAPGETPPPPEKEPPEKIEFSPVARESVTGVEADPLTSVRFGYKVLPEGSGVLRVKVEDLPPEIVRFFLGLAAEQEKANAS